MIDKQSQLGQYLADYRKTITFIDIIFGSYCIAMLAVSFIGWLQGMAGLRPILSIGGFLIFNAMVSELSRRSEKPQRLEVFRSIIGPAACILVFIGTQELYGGWWPCFLIMCIGGNILHTSLTRSARLGRAMVFVYLTTLLATEFFLHTNRDWYKLIVEAGAIGIMGVLFVEVLLLLTRSLYSERLNKNEIAEQKAQVEEHRAVIERKSTELESTYIHLTDSIRYAKRIQTALLPLEERIRKEFSGFFVLNRPKEIVSGDFYWFSKHGPEVFLAIADCTGHGVSGAMMTLIGNNLFNKIINEQKVVQPAEALQQLDVLLMETIQRHEVDDEAFTDGMDVALIRFNTETRQLVFAGAKRPLVIIRDENLAEIKGDRFSIGRSHVSDKKFTQHCFTVTPGTCIYLFTDGYSDQFGGKFNKKLMTRNFYEMLLEVHKKETYEQHFLLDRKLKIWRGTMPQTDDLMIAGILF